MSRRFEVVHPVDIVPDTQASAIYRTKTLGVNSTHHQAIHRLADPLRVTLSAADGVIEGPSFGRKVPDYYPGSPRSNSILNAST